MIITSIESRSSNIIIQLNTGESIKCPKAIFNNIEIYEGMEVESGDIRHLIETSAKESVQRKAMSLLSRTFLSEQQVIRKLKIRKYPNYLIKEAITFCKEYDLIDDKRYTKIAFLSLRRKNRSKRAIEIYLQKAGISSRLIEKVMYRLTDRRERISLKRTVIKYYPLYASKKNPEKSILQYVLSRGFTYSMSYGRIKKYCKKMREKDKEQE